MTQVKVVPEGFTTITPFLNLKGASEAIEFYKRAFGAETRRLFKSPTGVVTNAELQIGNSILRMSEAVLDEPTNSSLSLYVDNVDAWWKRAVDAGCQVVMPLENMFWGDRWGLLKDNYGTRWALATRIENISDAEIESRAAKYVPHR